MAVRYKHNTNPFGVNEYWKEFWSLLEKYPIENRTEYTDDEFCEALEIYRNQKIQESMGSSNPIIRMFAVLDRRVGKRTLKKIKLYVENQPKWLVEIYQLRLEAEKI